MVDENQLEAILGFEYDFDAADFEKYPFLLRPSRLGCGYITKDFHIKRDENYHFFTVHIIFSGCSFFSINGREFLLKKGDAFFIFPEESHSYHNLENAKTGYLWIEMDCTGYMDLIYWLKNNKVHTLCAEHNDNMLNELMHILLFAKENGANSQFELSTMCYRLIMDIYKMVYNKEHSEFPPFMQKALSLAHDYHDKSLTVKTLAKNLNVSESYVTKQFNKYIGTSPGRYILLKRVERAIFLLKTTDFSCEAIAEKCGFYDPAHLYKVFMAHTGKSPSQIRGGQSFSSLP